MHRRAVWSHLDQGNLFLRNFFGCMKLLTPHLTVMKRLARLCLLRALNEWLSRAYTFNHIVEVLLAKRLVSKLWGDTGLLHGLARWYVLLLASLVHFIAIEDVCQIENLQHRVSLSLERSVPWLVFDWHWGWLRDKNVILAEWARL